MDQKRIFENSISAAVNTLLNTIIYIKVVKYLNIKLRQIPVLWLHGFRTTVLKIKNAVVVVVFIFLKIMFYVGYLQAQS